MNITTFNTNEVKTMSSLEIAELTGKEHRNILADIRKMFKALEIQPAAFSADYKDSKGRTYECFNLTKELTITLVAHYSHKVCNLVVKRWLELEEENKAKIPNFNDPAEAAIAWAAEYKAKQAALKVLEEQKPAVKFATALNTTKNGLTLLETSKMFGMGRTRFCELLREKKYINHNNLPYQQWIDNGCFTVKSIVSDISGWYKKAATSTLVTGKGQRMLFDKHFSHVDNEKTRKLK